MDSSAIAWLCVAALLMGSSLIILFRDNRKRHAELLAKLKQVHEFFPDLWAKDKEQARQNSHFLINLEERIRDVVIVHTGRVIRDVQEAIITSEGNVRVRIGECHKEVSAVEQVIIHRVKDSYKELQNCLQGERDALTSLMEAVVSIKNNQEKPLREPQIDGIEGMVRELLRREAPSQGAGLNDPDNALKCMHMLRDMNMMLASMQAKDKAPSPDQSKAGDELRNCDKCRRAGKGKPECQVKVRDAFIKKTPRGDTLYFHQKCKPVPLKPGDGELKDGPVPV